MNSKTSASGVQFTSWMHEFTFYQWTDDINFRVSASSDSDDGVYIIEWEVEDSTDEHVDDQYNAPPRVVLQICASDSDEVIDVEVASIPE